MVFVIRATMTTMMKIFYGPCATVDSHPIYCVNSTPFLIFFLMVGFLGKKINNVFNNVFLMVVIYRKTINNVFNHFILTAYILHHFHLLILFAGFLWPQHLET